MNAVKQGFSVLIPDGDSEFALFATHCLARYPEVKVHALSRQRWAPMRFSRYCRSFTFVPPELDDDARLSAVADAVCKHQIDVLLPTETKWISFAVAHREAISRFVALAPVPDPDAFKVANNKWLLAQFLQSHDIPGPPTILVTCDETFEKQLRDMEFPVLLKPISAWGGEGIERFETASDLLRYVDQQGPDRIQGRFIVQTLLPGFVVGVNVLAREGTLLATTMQRGIIPNTHKYAAAGAIRFIKEERFAAIARRLVTALQWSGFANLDTLYDSRDDVLKILEINARFWGSLRGSLVAGVSFPYLACLSALNVPFEMPDYEFARYFHTSTAVRERLARLRGNARVDPFPLSQSGVKFLLSDPLAEGMRAFRQSALDKSSVS